EVAPLRFASPLLQEHRGLSIHFHPSALHLVPVLPLQPSGQTEHLRRLMIVHLLPAERRMEKRTGPPSVVRRPLQERCLPSADRPIPSCAPVSPEPPSFHPGATTSVPQ